MQKNISLLQNNLMGWYKKNCRPLPWRRTRDPYKIWISEIMLQQTTVVTVIPYYDRWIKVFPRIEDVAGAPLERILKMWQGLGYYQRARNIQKAAKIMKEFHGSRVPADSGILRALPGFGAYTTGAVLSIAFDQRHPIIDANVRRVVMRWLNMGGKADTTKDKTIAKFLEIALPSKEVGIFNQALMEIGALVCRSSSPQCCCCPVKSACMAYKEGRQERIPVKTKVCVKKVRNVVGLIEDNGRFFIQRRPHKGLWAGLWEFPGGEIRKNETSRQALTREFKERFCASLVSAKLRMRVKYSYTQFQACSDVWCCDVEPLPCAGRAQKWILRKDFKKYPFGSGSAKIIERLFPLA